MEQTHREFCSWIFIIVLIGLITNPFISQAALPGEEGWKTPLGLEGTVIVIPRDNPLTKEKVSLGKLLFFDKRLSKDNTIACSSCHLPNLAFTDGQPVSTGIHGLQGDRNAPATINRLFSTSQFWDGRAATLEEQSIGPLVSLVEHGFTNHDELVTKLKSIKGYQTLFQQVFQGSITKERIGQAIASFQRTILSGNSPYDRFDYGDEDEAISPSARRGLTLFLEKARCVQCHLGPNFTDEIFHNLGIDWDTNHIDLGRYTITKDPKDIGAFKTPTLREISRTAPYMHDGRFATLGQVVDFYSSGGIKNPHQDKTITPLDLTDQEKKDLIEFLKSLNGKGWQIKPPTKFPK